PQENVYMSQTSNSVTFRWAAETFSLFGPSTAEKVNFAATLNDDGRILFQYGPGNQNLAGAFTVRGCGPGPAIGISPGHDDYAQPFNLPNLENSPTVHFDPPFNFSSVPAAVIESPSADRHVQGVLQVTGAAYDTDTFISRIDIFIDGVQRARTFPSISRPDLCAAQKLPGCPFVGFSLPLDLIALGLKPGSHALRVRVTNARGALADFPDAPINFVLDAGQARQPYGKIESPADGDTVSGPVLIRGYVVDDDLRITGVDTLIDGITYGPTIYGQTRDDICSALSTKPPNCPRAGFAFTLPTVEAAPPVPDGAHTLQIRVRDETGRYTLIPDAAITINVSNGAAVPVTGVLTSPRSNDHVNGTIHVSGYAYSPGQRIVSAILRVDGEVYGAVHLGEDRSAECAQLPGVTACPNIGFSEDFDTTRVVNGPHILGITLRNARGDSVTIPQVDNGGINIFVEN
ncbi:MAG: hypothetical protein M3Z85_00535, partial [Acidobacteriota bacterium]|nr:hypothetical protein [Acidobacteriota bacterium]